MELFFGQGFLTKTLFLVHYCVYFVAVVQNKLVTLLILVCLILVCFPILVVKAQATIIIRADGTVEGTDKILRDGNVYSFLGNISVDFIIVERDNIVIDGANYFLENTGGDSQVESHGIVLSERSNVTVKNLQILNFDRGLNMKRCSNITITGNCIYVNSANSVGTHLFSCYKIRIIDNRFVSEVNSGYGILIDNFYLSSNSVKNFLLRNSFANLSVAFLNIYSAQNTIAGSTFSNCTTCVALQSCEYDKLVGNVFENSEIGIEFKQSSNNTIYHNNFVNNQQNVAIQESDAPWLEKSYVNRWDNGFEGNYWSDYSGTVTSGDGIGSTPHIINEENQDNCPLFDPKKIVVSEVPTGSGSLFDERRFQVHDSHAFYHVTIVTNSTFSDFYFLYDLMRISFYVNGTAGTTGLCNVTIPSEFMSTQFSVFKDEKPLTKNTDYTQTFNGTHYLFTITYDHSSHLIHIYANNNIPEFPSMIVLPFLIVGISIFIIIQKNLSKKKGGLT